MVCAIFAYNKHLSQYISCRTIEDEVKMKLLHISDLHLGKIVHAFSMLDDQKHMLDQINEILIKERIDALLISGDVYDKSVPPAEAVELLDDFLTRAAEAGVAVAMVAGNHDSPERLNFGSRLLRSARIHVAGSFGGTLNCVTLHDEYGEVRIYLLPFVKPASVRVYCPSVQSYDEAFAFALGTAKIEPTVRNVLLAHQFVVGTHAIERCESETHMVGGLDEVHSDGLDRFDYVALGHIHGAQYVCERVRYSGTPLKYSFSEVRHKKSATLIQLRQKGDMEISTLPLTPKRDLRVLTGPLEQLVQCGKEDIAGREDYIKAELTDEEDLYEPLLSLRSVYPNTMLLERRSKESAQFVARDVRQKTPLALFGEFFSQITGESLEGEREQTVQSAIAAAQEDVQ